MDKSFSYKESFKFGFSDWLEHFGLMFSLTIAFAVIQAINLLAFGLYLGLSLASGAITLLPFTRGFVNGQLAPISMQFLFWAGSIFLVTALIYRAYTIGIINISLKIYDSNDAKFSDFFSKLNLYIKCVVAHIIYFLLVFVGAIFFIIPGIYLFLRYHFYMIIIVEKNVGIFEAFRLSTQITKGALINLLGFSFLWLLFTLLVLSILPIAVFFLLPIYYLSLVYVYKTLHAQTFNY